jgi:hypothetical protein
LLAKRPIPLLSNQLRKGTGISIRRCSGNYYALVIVKLLNSSDVYGAFNQVFGEYGLKIEVTGAEKIATTIPEQLGLKRNGVSRLPSGATLEMVLRPRATE